MRRMSNYERPLFGSIVNTQRRTVESPFEALSKTVRFRSQLLTGHLIVRDGNPPAERS